jgi:hypothetical protein
MLMAGRRSMRKDGVPQRGQAIIRLPDLSEKSAPPRRRRRTHPVAPGWFAELWQLARLLVVLLTAGEERREIVANRVIYVMSGKARRRAPTLITRLTLLLALLALPRAAGAQATRVLTPTEMFDPENSPGVPLGKELVLRDETTLQGQGNSNIYNVDTDRRSDTIGILQSDLHLGTNTARHMAELTAGNAAALCQDRRRGHLDLLRRRARQAGPCPPDHRERRWRAGARL